MLHFRRGLHVRINVLHLRFHFQCTIHQEMKLKKGTQKALTTSLGLDVNNCCIRHPNQVVCMSAARPSKFGRIINACRICNSECEAGGKRQRSSLVPVIADLQKLQADSQEWRKRTNILYNWNSKLGLAAEEEESSENSDELNTPVILISENEWREQVRQRIQQVHQWTHTESDGNCTTSSDENKELVESLFKALRRTKRPKKPKSSRSTMSSKSKTTTTTSNKKTKKSKKPSSKRKLNDSKKPTSPKKPSSKRKSNKPKSSKRKKSNLDRAFLRATFQHRVRKLIILNQFFEKTAAMKAFLAEKAIDRKSFARANPQESRIKGLSMDVNWADDDVLVSINEYEKNPESLHNELFYSEEEIKLFRFEKFMEDHADEFEIVEDDDDEDGEIDEFIYEIIEEEEEEEYEYEEIEILDETKDCSASLANATLIPAF